MSTTISAERFLTVRGSGDASSVLSYLPEGSRLDYVSDDGGSRFTVIAVITVSQVVRRGESADQVLSNLEDRLTYVCAYSVDRLASGLYGAVVTGDEADIDAGWGVAR